MALDVHIPLSVISANVKLALRCRSTLSENTSVLRARRGSPEKKSVSPRYVYVNISYLIVPVILIVHSQGIEAGLQLPLARYLLV